MARAGRATLALAVAAALSGLSAAPAGARVWRLRGDGESRLAEVLRQAAAGDRVVVEGGRHRGPLVVDRPLTLVGRGWPVIEGPGRGTVISVRAPGTGISGFVIRGSGSSLDEENSGLTLDESPGSRVVGNRFEDVLFGIYVRRSPETAIVGNRIRSKRLELPRRGDAVRVWYSDDVVIEGNRVESSRDVVLWYSERLTVRENTVAGGRYGLHFMYCDDAAIERNLLVDNSVGAFLMYSRRLRLRQNTISGNHGPSGFGVGLKDMDDAEITGNRFIGNRIGAFLDNSPREAASTIRLSGNLLAGNDVGISLLPNVRRGRFLDNSFVENQQQVEIAGGGADAAANLWRGNFWSTYTGYDGDGDGTGDVAFQADLLFEDLADRRPALKLFLYSPAKEALEVAARTLPLIRPRPKVVDEAPRMRAGEPTGCPPLVVSAGFGFRGLGLSLLLLAAGLLAAPAAVGRRQAAPRSSAGTGSAGSPPESSLAEGRAGRAAGAPRVIVSVRKVGKRFGDNEALAGVSFEIAAGESVAVWGPNGAGKTTLLRVLLGIMPFTGEARVAGIDPRRDGKASRAAIGFVPQEVALQRDLGVDETLELFARLRRVPAGRIGEVLARLALEGQTEQRVGELSGGQRQRLALALALLSEPPILLLDEPTANLDARARAGFIALLGGLREGGLTLLFSSHRPEEVLSLADRVLHLDAGRLVADGPPAELLSDAGRRAEMWLRVAPGEIEPAAGALRAAGFEPRRLGDHLVVEVSAGGKLAAIRAVDGCGVELLDFEVDLVDRRGSGS